MVYDEERQEWVPRWGYKGKNKDKEEQWIHEVPNNAGACPRPTTPLEDRLAHVRARSIDPNFDPRAAAKQERKARSLKNESQRLQNLQRVAANAAQQVQASTQRASQRDVRRQEIEHTLKASKKSTASLGKFDDKLKGEGREKNIKRKVGGPLFLVVSSLYTSH